MISRRRVLLVFTCFFDVVEDMQLLYAWILWLAMINKAVHKGRNSIHGPEANEDGGFVVRSGVGKRKMVSLNAYSQSQRLAYSTCLVQQIAAFTICTL